MHTYLEFETTIKNLEGQIQTLKSLEGDDKDYSVEDEISKLEAKVEQALKDLYSRLTPWQKTQVARHPGRPHFLDYRDELITDYTEMAGDRAFGDDAAILGGLGRIGGKPIVVIGQEKGRTTQDRLKHNFGMARPEGYRKAIRLMELANRFQLPVVTFVDTAGAYPGIGAEERGQAEAIARSIDACLGLDVPLITAVIGEGGSGGAVAIATSNHIIMLEHSIYTVASPEASASILWRDSARAQDAATNMKITAQDLLEFGVIDEIVPEPLGGAHRGAKDAIRSVGNAITGVLSQLEGKSGVALRTERQEKFLTMGRSLT